jgi:putative membrane protein insertion efficiency factor
VNKKIQNECSGDHTEPLSVTQRLLLLLVRFYQLTLSPMIGGQCRFYPTCSHYATDAIHRHGAGRGMWLATKRLARCHPFHPGGIDLVPDNDSPSPLRTHPGINS